MPSLYSTALKFLSTPSARRATCLAVLVQHGLEISIHALREEGDFSAAGVWPSRSYFYPRPPRGGRRTGVGPDYRPPTHFYPRPPRGGRPLPPRCGIILMQFLSTPSARRATWAQRLTAYIRPYFYPRPPRGGRQGVGRLPDGMCVISIHALREEGDPLAHGAESDPAISIHALREEGDAATLTLRAQIENFYPRPPRGGRRCFCQLSTPVRAFLSTPSARRATERLDQYVRCRWHFYPRPPRGGRRG